MVLGEQADALCVAIAAMICGGEPQRNRRAHKARAGKVILRLNRTTVGTRRCAASPKRIKLPSWFNRAAAHLSTRLPKPHAFNAPYAPAAATVFVNNLNAYLLDYQLRAYAAIDFLHPRTASSSGRGTVKQELSLSGLGGRYIGEKSSRASDFSAAFKPGCKSSDEPPSATD
jgi:hypothetical protein